MNEPKFSGKTYGRSHEGNAIASVSAGSTVATTVVGVAAAAAAAAATTAAAVGGSDGTTKTSIMEQHPPVVTRPIELQVKDFANLDDGLLMNDKSVVACSTVENALPGSKSIILNFKPVAVPKGTKITIADTSTKAFVTKKSANQGLKIISKTASIIRPASPRIVSQQMPPLTPVQSTAASVKTLLVTPSIPSYLTSSGITKMSANDLIRKADTMTSIAQVKSSTQTESTVTRTIVTKPIMKNDDIANGNSLIGKNADKLPEGMMLLTLPNAIPITVSGSNQLFPVSVVQPNITTQSANLVISNSSISSQSTGGNIKATPILLKPLVSAAVSKSALYPGLKQIPKDTIVKQITSKDLVDIKKLIIDKSVTTSTVKSTTPIVTITQKATTHPSTMTVSRLNPPTSGGEIITIPLTDMVKMTPNEIVSNSKVAIPSGKQTAKLTTTTTTTTTDSQKMANPQISNGKITELKQTAEKQPAISRTSDSCLEILPVKDIKEEEPIEIIDNDTVIDGDLSTELFGSSAKRIKIEESDDTEMKENSINPTNNGQTMLRNKLLENIKKSPRLQKRSNSLITITRRPYKRRKRLPSAPSVSLSPSTGDLDITQIGDKPEKPPDIKLDLTNFRVSLFDSLECTEKLDESDKSKSVSPIDNILPTNRSALASMWHQDDPQSYIRWKAGVGYMYNSNLHFKLNEFRLIEIADEKDFVQDRIDKNFENKLNFSRIGAKSKDKAPFICRVCYKSCDKELCTIECSVVHNARQNKIKSRLEQAIVAASILKMPPTNRIVSEDTIREPHFQWEKYLKQTNGTAAPASFFLNPYPSSVNLFEINMKLEAIDPNNCSFFCVCTIVDKQGFRIKLRFDGYDSKYDFWKNADSMEIFPPGFCTKIVRQLLPPPGYGVERFDWSAYLKKCNASAATRALFTHLNSKKYPNSFKIGMKLEAEDRKSRRKLRVATIGAILYNRILVQFDGYNESHDYWTDMSSPYIHPVNWHMENCATLAPPPEYSIDFKWSSYLKAKQAEAVPETAFCTRSPVMFEAGMKLEIVDRKVPALIRPATITQVKDFEIQVLYDGWPTNYAYWMEDDNPDIHPINWCARTGHIIELPAVSNYCKFNSSCGVLGCRELGNAKYPDIPFHDNLADCPYESRNWTNSNDTNRLADYYQQRKTNAQRFRAQSRSILKPHNQKRSKFEPIDTVLDGISRIVVSPDPTTMIPVEAILSQPIIPKIENEEIDKRIGISRGILDRYGPIIQEKYDLWKSNTSKLEQQIKRENNLAKNPIEWTIDDVVEYVSQLHDGPQVPTVFRNNDIDGLAFLSLSQEDLTNLLHLRTGPSIKIYNQIIVLREEVAINYL